MKEPEDYLSLISRRGNRDGSGGGLLSLLEWCGKLGVRDVTEDEARRFWQNPDAPYTPTCAKAKLHP